MEYELIKKLFLKEQVMKIFSCLAKNPARFSDIFYDTRLPPSTLTRYLRKMESLGLIEMKHDPTKSHGQRLRYRLTEKGREVSDLISEINKLIQKFK